jgi:hypothetical protein
LSAAKRGTMTLGKPRICGGLRCPMRVSGNFRRLCSLQARWLTGEAIVVIEINFSA